MRTNDVCRLLDRAVCLLCLGMMMLMAVDDDDDEREWSGLAGSIHTEETKTVQACCPAEVIDPNEE